MITKGIPFIPNLHYSAYTQYNEKLKIKMIDSEKCKTK